MKQSTRLAVTRHFLALITILVGVGLLSACGDDETAETIHVKGHLTYPQNTPLPDNANARISLTEDPEPTQDDAEQAGPQTQQSGKRIVAEQTLHNLKEKPIGFDLQVGRALLKDAGSYLLKAQIIDAEGQVQWHTAKPLPIEPSQAGQRIELTLAPTPDNIAVLSFTRATCEDGFAFAIATQPDRAVLRVDDRIMMLPRVESASGVKYDDEQNIYWSKAREALVQIDGQQHSNCKPENTKNTTAPNAAKDTATEEPEKAPQTQGQSTQERQSSS